ncbi:protein SRC2-like [Vicia villosa]|uniref:protein SRC2-like n=1 Tax=Vicia villosa TaxID=3911 RepID=UPI00273C6C12|nr:protein SRC2-like [Vicia villosa]
MEYKTLQLNLASAKDLNNVNLLSKMQVYAIVSISGDPANKQKTKTPLDREGGTNPAWNFSAKLTFNELLARQNRLTLEINLRCSGSLAVDKDVGSVQVPLSELVKQTGDGKTFQHVSYQVRKPNGKPKGSFNFSYKINEPVNHNHKVELEPVMVTGYPSPAMGSNSAPYPIVYPPPPTQPQYPDGYTYPSPSPLYGEYQQTPVEYFYPPQNGYVYPPPPHEVPVAKSYF